MVADAGTVTARLAVLVAALCCAACGAGPYYHWGPYEDLVYEMYTEPGKAGPEVQVERLARDVEKTLSRGERVPPGVHAHLGYMYFLTGNLDAARAALETEKRLYPEGAVFVDRLLAKMAAAP